MTRVIDSCEIDAAFAEAAGMVRSGTQDQRAGKVLPVGPVTLLRQKLGLSCSEFADRYRIPIDTLRGWERGAIEPDAVATALLALIAADPDGVARVLEARRTAVAAAE